MYAQTTEYDRQTTYNGQTLDNIRICTNICSVAINIVTYEFIAHLHLQGATCENFGVVTHVHGVEIFIYKVSDPITDLIVAHHDEASLISVKGVANQECCPTAVVMGQQVRWIDAVAQKEGIPPFLRP